MIVFEYFLYFCFLDCHFIIIYFLHKKHHVIKHKHVYNHEDDSHAVWRLRKVILTTSVQCQWWNLIIHWFWRRWIRYAWSSEMLRTYRLWLKCTLVCTSVSSSTKDLWECLSLLWSRYEILLTLTRSASNSMNLYHCHDFWSQVNLSRF